MPREEPNAEDWAAGVQHNGVILKLDYRMYLVRDRVLPCLTFLCFCVLCVDGKRVHDVQQALQAHKLKKSFLPTRPVE